MIGTIIQVTDRIARFNVPGFATAALSVGICTAATACATLDECDEGDDSTTPWIHDPCDPMAHWTLEFESIGLEPEVANRLAHLLIYNVEPTEGDTGCDYYNVTTYYCDGLTRRVSRQLVGTVCIEAALGLCVHQPCPLGSKGYYRLTTAASCSPASTCAWVQVDGPLFTNQENLCDDLVDCSCWPNLDCTDWVCVPVASTSGNPKGCPICFSP